MNPEPRFSGLVLNHQDLEELELKNHTKTAVFNQIWLFLSSFFVLFLLKVDGRAPNLGSGVTYITPDTHGHPGGGGVVFSYDLGQLRVRSVSVA